MADKFGFCLNNPPSQLNATFETPLALWRGDLSPMGGEAAPNLNPLLPVRANWLGFRLLRSRSGINPLTTKALPQGPFIN
jgi:hypothetical protein